MNLTSKSRYALKIIIDLARHYPEPVVRRMDIAKRQGVSPEYLDQIMMRLRASDLVTSIRGRQGGYRLRRAPEEISVWDLFEAAEGPLFPVRCLGDATCVHDHTCDSKGPWQLIFSSLKRPLEKLRISDLTAYSPPATPSANLDFIQECRGEVHGPYAKSL